MIRTKIEVHGVVKNIISMYIETEFNDTTNLLGITSVRNIIYILTDLEKELGFVIDDSFIKEIKNLTVENLTILISKYS